MPCMYLPPLKSYIIMWCYSIWNFQLSARTGDQQLMSFALAVLGLTIVIFVRMTLCIQLIIRGKQMRFIYWPLFWVKGASWIWYQHFRFEQMSASFPLNTKQRILGKRCWTYDKLPTFRLEADESLVSAGYQTTHIE